MRRPTQGHARKRKTLEWDHPIPTQGGVTEIDLKDWGAKFGSPAIFVSLVEWADRIVTE